MNCDTACSSSFVALHNACNAIWKRDCDTAIVGGMNICTSSDNFNGLTAGHFLSPTGGCKTWDESADGYCRGEAVASVVIKPLDAAQNDNDNILGVLTSMGTNYSSHAESITRPHAGDQEKLYRQILYEAGITPYDVDYVEMHGTGTQAGDQVEMASITNVFAPMTPVRSPENPLYLSATKSNVGHGESASGVTALIKTLLVLREETLPPHVGIKTKMNPKLPALEPRNVRIAHTPTSLPSKRGDGAKRRVMLNNFSAAGGNTACILEEAPARSSADADTYKKPFYPITVSAKSATSMAKNVDNLLAYIDKHPDVSLADLSYTTTARRIHHNLRKGFVAASMSDLKKQLLAFDKNQKNSQKKTPKVVFCFSGQGAFYKSLARELFETCSTFKNDILRMDGTSEAHGFGSFLPALEEASDDESISQKQIHLATCAVQIALTRFLRSMGIAPSLSIGHSLGEYAALHASGVLSETDVLYLVGQRAALIEEHCSKGTHSMLVIQAGDERLRTLLGPDLAFLEVACLNSPQQLVLTGPDEKVSSLQDKLKQEGVLCRRLDLPFAFHSSQMNPMLNLFEEAASSVKYQTPSTPFASPLLGSTILSPESLGPSYLRQHLRETNNFYGAVKDCDQKGLVDETTIWLELGPHSLCLDMVKASLGTQTRAAPLLQKGENSWSVITKCLSSLYNWGAEVDWQEFHSDSRGLRLLDLPKYGWNNKDYWIPYENDWLLNKDGAASNTKNSAPISLGGPETTTVQRLTSRETSGEKVSLTFESDLTDSKLHAVIAGHVINGSALCPASVYADVALTIADYVRNEHLVKFPASAMSVGPMEILRPILLPRQRPSEKTMLKLSATADLSSGKVSIIYSVMGPGQSSYRDTAKCVVSFSKANDWVSDWSESAYLLEARMDTLSRDLITGSTNRFTRGLAYQLFGAFVEYDEKFQGMKEILINIDALEALATLDLYANSDAGVFHCSPFWVDSFMHLSGFILNVNDKFEREGIKFISDGWSSFKLAEDISPKMAYKVHFKVQDRGDSLFTGNASIFRDGKIMGKVEGLRFKGVPLSVMNAIIPPPSGSSKHASAPDSTAVKSREGKKTIAERHAPASKSQKEAAPAPSKPSSSFQDALAVIADEVGVPIDEMSLDSTPGELGIDSLLSLTLVSKLNGLYSMDLPPTIFQGDLKIKDLHKYFPSMSTSPSVGSQSSSTSGTSTPASSLDLNRDSAPETKFQATDSKQQALRSLVTEEIGICEDDLMAADDLSQLGIDSLMTLTIVESARVNLGITIDLDMLGKGISMAELEEKLGFSSKPQAPPAQQKQKEATKLPLSILLQGSSAPQSANLFLFPDGSGSAASYLGMPNVSSSFKVYGLNSPFLKKGRVAITVEDMVSAWISEIQSVQPSGPYHLAGWSAGGYYAFEVTKALLKAGKEVEKLIFIDTPPMNVYEAMPLDLLDWLDRNKVMGGEGKASPSWLVDHFEGTLKALTSYKPTPLQGPRFPQVSVVWASEGVLKGLGSNVPQPPLTTKVSGFLTQQRNTDIPYGWEELVAGCELFVAGMTGNHFTMVLSPNVSRGLWYVGRDS